MRSYRHVGIALGFLGGTTLGSGISFLFRLEPVQLMLCVTLCGLGGILAGLLVFSAWQSRFQER
ncbi:MAG: hypothetical protein IKE29_07130 [Paenibacillus sp.]|uniref:hypothetical protein n=1 Tax=Paenibacillus sp. TaxID=58172 RepID=UPI0025FA7220|nr:hypothetical protein [Paenibacillus sp.]MBR2564378.1 hypothetical protein [Paenibacillus sp.]